MWSGAFAGLARGRALSLGAATGYNAFIFSDFTETGTDSQGKLVVGGNFAPAGGGSYGVATLHSADAAGTWDLVAGGFFTNQNGMLGGGDAFVGGNLTWTTPTLPHNVYVNGNFSNPATSGSVGGTVNYAGTYASGTTLAHVHTASATPAPIDFLSAKTQLQSLSSTLASQAANGTISDNGFGAFTLTGVSSSINAFNLTGSTFTNSRINITAPAGSTVIVNVSGASDSFSGVPLTLNGVSAGNVLTAASWHPTLRSPEIPGRSTVS